MRRHMLVLLDELGGKIFVVGGQVVPGKRILASSDHLLLTACDAEKGSRC